MRRNEDVLSWDEYFMSVALLSAKRSRDPVDKEGACIVNEHNRIVAIGYQGMPRGIENDALPWTSSDDCDSLENKSLYVCHAVVNAILNKNQQDVRKCRIFTTSFPCNECAKLITQCGLKRVIYRRESKPGCMSSEASRKLFSLAGISTVHFNGPFEILDLCLNA